MMDPFLSDRDIVFTNEPFDPNISVRDVATYGGPMACHRSEQFEFKIPYTAFDSGRVDYDTIEAVVTCPICGSSYVASNVGKRLRVRLLPDDDAVSHVSEAIRAEIRNSESRP